MLQTDIFSEATTIFPLLAQMKNIPQDPLWHAEGNLAEHAQLTLEKAQDRSENRLLIFAALLHDIGKIFTTKQGEDNIISPGHSYAGFSYLATRITRLTEFSPKQLDRLLALIRFHHHPKRVVNKPQISLGKLAFSQRVAGNQLFYQLALCDVEGRICSDQSWQLEQVELFRLYCEEENLFEPPIKPLYETWHMFLKERFSLTIVQQAVFWRIVRDFELQKIYSLEEGIFRNFRFTNQQFSMVHILSGPPGSGKSSFLRQHLGNLPVVSLDEIRKKHHNKKLREGRIRQDALEAFRVSLRKKEDVVWDSTNLTRNQRRRIIGLARKYGAFVHLYGFQVDPNDLLHRNANRTDQVPEKVVQAMSERYEFPDFNEADLVHIVDENGISRILGNI